VPGGDVTGGVPGGEVTGADAEGVALAGPAADDVGRAPGCAAGDGPPPHAARPATTAPTAATRVISRLFMA
jgi:hypothetical protein